MRISLLTILTLHITKQKIERIQALFASRSFTQQHTDIISSLISFFILAPTVNKKTVTSQCIVCAESCAFSARSFIASVDIYKQSFAVHISATAADHASLSVSHSCTLLSPQIHAAQPHCREINSISFLRNMLPSLHRHSLQGLHSHTIPPSLSFTPLTVSAF